MKTLLLILGLFTSRLLAQPVPPDFQALSHKSAQGVGFRQFKMEAQMENPCKQEINAKIDSAAAICARPFFKLAHGNDWPFTPEQLSFVNDLMRIRSTEILELRQK